MPTSDFYARVRIGADDECWPWLGPVDTRGYGHLRYDGRIWRAHRLSYTLNKGPIPKGDGPHGTVVMHACDNKRCCNPKHLSLGTHADNMADMARKGRAHRHAGTDNGRAVLTPAQVAEIMADSRGTRTIAKDYPVSRAAIQRIKSGKSWAILREAN